MTAFYQGKRVLVTGGLGFIGSNLCLRLVELGADVMVVDSMLPDYGATIANLANATALKRSPYLEHNSARQFPTDMKRIQILPGR